MPTENALGFLRALDSGRSLPPVIVVFGSKAFLREFIVKALSERLSEQGLKYRSFQIGGASDFSGLTDEVRAPDLFAPKRLVVARVLKSHRATGDTEEGDDDSVTGRPSPPGGEAELAELIENGVQPNQLVLVYERDSVPARIKKVAERSALLVNCMRPFDNQLPDYVQLVARVRGLKLGSGVANFLVENHAGDLGAIANALEKAAVVCDANKPLTAEDLGEPGRRKMPDVFEIADSIARGRASSLMAQIDCAMELGRDPFEILGVEIIPVMRRMLIAATMLAHRRGAGEIAAVLGGSPTSGFVARAIDGARRFGLERLRKGYQRATELDEGFKNGSIMEREQAINRLLLGLVAER